MRAKAHQANTMGNQYFRCDWRHSHPDEPVIIFYEVTPDDDVSRTIDVFADGRAHAEQVSDYAGRENELPGVNSLVEGAFSEWMDYIELGVPDISDSEELLLNLTNSEEFEANWRRYRAIS